MPEVSAEAAGEAARRSVPLLRVPASLELELDGVLAERGVKPKEARRLAVELTERLKSLSHTPQRGGFGPAIIKPAPPLGGRLRGAELLAAREAFEAGVLLAMDDRAANAALGLPPPLRDDQKHAPQMERLAPKYRTQDEVVAYVVARMVPEYAVCRRVLDEAMRLLQAAGALKEAGGGAAEAATASAGGKWRPREALVHGAGVGAAVAAALEAVVSPSLVRLVALEPSPLRQMLGSRVVQAHRQRQLPQQGQEEQQQLELEHDQADAAAEGSAAVQLGRQQLGRDMRRREAAAAAGLQVSWVQALPPLTKATKGQRRRYDLVIAPYQLTVLPTVEERARLVRELWERCGDVLVLVEPGTPRGFAAVAEARELLLGRETRKRAQLEAAASAASGGPYQGDGGAADPRVRNKLRGAGAHVVAPCTHDGACPMQGSKRHWCHFSQPLLLPSFMQQALVSPGERARGGGRALNVQDERFSYLILRRGPRPALRVAVARDYDTASGGLSSSEGGGGDDAAGSSVTAVAAAGSSVTAVAAAKAAAALVPSRLPPGVVLSQVMLNRAAAAVAGASAAGAEAAPDSALGPLYEHTAAGGTSRHSAPRRSPLFRGPKDGTEHDTASSAVSIASDGDSSGVAGTAQGAAATVAPLAGAGPQGPGLGPGHGPVISAFARKYPAYGPGLVGRLIAMQGAGVDWSAPAVTAAEDLLDEEAAKLSDDDETAAAAVSAAARFDGMPAPGPAEAEAADVDAEGRNGDSGGRGVGGGRSPGLDAAIAELSLSGLAGAHELPEAGTTAIGGNGKRINAAGSAALPVAGVTPPPPRFATLPHDDTWEARRAEAGDGQLKLPLQSPSPVQRGDISDKEYEQTEQQLVERIYGAAAGRAWLAIRQPAARRQLQQQGRGDQAAEEEEEEMDPEEDVEEEEDESRLAEAASYSWGRLVRSPRLRGGHVILDMCVGPQHHYPNKLGDSQGSTAGAAISSVVNDNAKEQEDTEAAAVALKQERDADIGSAAAGAGGGGAAAEEAVAGCPEDASLPVLADRPRGRLVQQVVARSARRGWMGAPAYRLARRLSWGDCWPDWYIRGHNARETGSPRACEAQGSGGDPKEREQEVREDEPRLGGWKRMQTVGIR